MNTAAENPVFNQCIKAQHKVAKVLLENADRIALTFDERQTPPAQITTSKGQTVYLDFEDALEVGDRLVSTNNQWLIVEAAPEELFFITKGQAHLDEFLHVAGIELWPVQFLETEVATPASHECLHMLEHFGLQHRTAHAPFSEFLVPDVEVHACNNPEHQHHHHHDDGHHDCGHDHHH